MLYIFRANYSFYKHAANIEVHNLIFHHKEFPRKIL